MKINEVPQDGNILEKGGEVRDVCYAVDENGEYTNLEMYLNSLVQDIMDKCREGGTVVE